MGKVSNASLHRKGQYLPSNLQPHNAYYRFCTPSQQFRIPYIGVSYQSVR